MALEIATTNEGSSIFTVRLLSNIYSINTYYNNTLSMWYLNLFDSNNIALALGAALVPNINILRNFPGLSTSFGELRVIDLSGEGNATPTSLGDTSKLIYYSPGEFDTTYPNYDNPATKALAYDFNTYFTYIGQVPY